MRTSLKRSEIIELHNALCTPELKVKPLSGENFISILKLKNKLKAEISIISEGEKTLALESNFEMDGSGRIEAPAERMSELREFGKKMKSFQEQYVLENLTLNFIPEKEMIEYVKQMDTAVAAVLFDYLLKGE